MLRWSIVLMSLASSGCVLGGGIDLPSTDVGPDEEPSFEGSDGMDSSDGGIDISPPSEAPSGSGGSPCCEDPNLGGASGSESGGAAP